MSLNVTNAFEKLVHLSKTILKFNENIHLYIYIYNYIYLKVFVFFILVIEGTYSQVQKCTKSFSELVELNLTCEALVAVYNYLARAWSTVAWLASNTNRFYNTLTRSGNQLFVLYFFHFRFLLFIPLPSCLLSYHFFGFFGQNRILLLDQLSSNQT